MERGAAKISAGSLRKIDVGWGAMAIDFKLKVMRQGKTYRELKWEMPVRNQAKDLFERGE
jgi:hypothetical protein